VHRFKPVIAQQQVIGSYGAINGVKSCAHVSLTSTQPLKQITLRNSWRIFGICLAGGGGYIELISVKLLKLLVSLAYPCVRRSHASSIRPLHQLKRYAWLLRASPLLRK
jgi:hypothetical protein